MDFKIKGHSSYKLSLEENFVKKSADSKDDRLVASANKQKSFYSQLFKTPKIYDITSSHFTMDYIEGHSFIQFLTYATKNDLDKLIKKLEGYFAENIEGKIMIDGEVFKRKIESIDKQYLSWFNDFPPEIEVYSGQCHGDLTFSNMIFSNDIYFIDFLDSYIESPTMDLIKLRQDTHLHWSLEMSEQKYDLNKILVALLYLDNWIQDTYQFDYYNFLQKINLLRILPYAKTTHIKNFISNKFHEL